MFGGTRKLHYLNLTPLKKKIPVYFYQGWGGHGTCRKRHSSAAGKIVENRRDPEPLARKGDEASQI